MTTDERKLLQSQGLRRCTACSEVKTRDDFYTDKRRSDGCQAICKACHIQKVNEYHNTERGRRVFTESKNRYARIHRKTGSWAIRESAHHAVCNSVASGKIPSIRTRVCEDCGVQAQEYHHESYEREHWLDVVPLCRQCHNRRHNHA